MKRKPKAEELTKPEWWPECPYPEDVFTMTIDDYVNYIPDERIRTALSGCLGREFWKLADAAIWRAYCEKMYDI